MRYVPYTFVMTLLSLSLYAQGTQESTADLSRQKEVLEANGKLNDYKTELIKLQNELQEKTRESQEAAEKSRQSALANTQAATQLSNSPQDKKLANEANKRAKDAQKDAKSARKASENQENLEKEIASLQTKITDEEKKISGMQGVAYNAAPSTTASSTSQPAPQQSAGNAQAAAVTAPQQPVYQQQQQPVYQQQQPVYQQQQQPVNYQVQPNNYTVNHSDSASQIANRVVEQTYKSFAQQPGQPAIIINNIIIPSDYNKSGQQQNMQAQNYGMSPQERQDFEDYKMWLRQQRGQNPNNYQPVASPYQNPAPAAAAGERLTFKERFGERKPRKSGMWVIPTVGIHASNFDANVKDGTAEGRSGFNAGLDFRIHMRRFFIQPGAHYFSTSTQVTDEEGVADAPLLDGPRIHSLKVPLMLGLYLTKEQGTFFKFNVKAGAVGNYVLNVDRGVQTQFRKDNLEQYSYGAIGGIGIEFGFITIDLSHEWGITKLFKDSDKKNNILRATLGFKI